MKKLRNPILFILKKINLEIYQDIFLNKKKIETREAKAFLQQRIPEVKRKIKNEIDFHTKNMLNNY